MTMKQYMDIVQARLSKARWQHCVNVSKEAVRLAERYGADVKKAETAGILHDITKETPPQQQLQILEQCGIILTNIESAAPKLWHAMSGAAYIEHELGVTDKDILNAVRYHTTGRANMSLLEKIIYIADFTSAERDYDGVENLRRAVDCSLGKAMIEGMAFTIQDLAQKKTPIHPDSFVAYNDIMMREVIE